MSPQDLHSSFSQIGSPLWFEHLLASWNKKIFSGFVKMAEKSVIFSFLLIAALSLLALIYRFEIIEQLFPKNYQTFFHAPWTQNRIWTFIYLYLFGYFIWLRRAASELVTALLFSGFVFVYWLAAYDEPQTGLFQIFNILLIYIFMALPLFYLHKYNLKYQILFLIFVAFVEVYLTYALKQTGFQAGSSLAFRAFIPFSFLALEHQLKANTLFFDNSKTTSYVFSPVTFLSFTPVKTQDWKKSDDVFKTMMLGFVDTLVALFGFYMCTLILKHFPRFQAGGIIDYWLAGLRLSLAYFFSSWAIFRAGTGIGRWFGYALPDPSHFALLAVNPIESWKKWSTYLYEWMKYVLFLPSLRFTKSIFIAFVFTFGAMFVLHYSNALPNILAWDFQSLGQKYWLIGNLFFFLSQGFLVYLTSLTRAWWPAAHRRNGWWGVLMTQILLGVTHTFIARM